MEPSAIVASANAPECSVWFSTSTVNIPAAGVLLPFVGASVVGQYEAHGVVIVAASACRRKHDRDQGDDDYC